MTLEQSRRKERGLEEEVKRLTQELADSLRLLKELQGEEGARTEERREGIKKGRCGEGWMGEGEPMKGRESEVGVDEASSLSVYCYLLLAV